MSSKLNAISTKDKQKEINFHFKKILSNNKFIIIFIVIRWLKTMSMPTRKNQVHRFLLDRMSKRNIQMMNRQILSIIKSTLIDQCHNRNFTRKANGKWIIMSIELLKNRSLFKFRTLILNIHCHLNSSITTVRIIETEIISKFLYDFQS